MENIARAINELMVEVRRIADAMERNEPKDEPQIESKYLCKSCKHRKTPKEDYPCEYCYEGSRYEL